MRRTVPSRRDGADGNCGRLVRRQTSESTQRDLALRPAARPSGREPGARNTRGSHRLPARVRRSRSSRASTSRSASRSGSRSSTVARRSTTCGRSRRATASVGSRRPHRSGSRQCEVPPEQRFRKCEDAVPDARSRSSNSSATARSARARCAACRCSRGCGARASRSGRSIRRATAPCSRSIRRRSASSRPTDGPFENEHERDALSSARVMWDERETVAALSAATDPTTRLEGDIWFPTASP